jgi:hypothetical protein
MPMPNASTRGRKYGSSELTLVLGIRWRIVNAAASAATAHGLR